MPPARCQLGVLIACLPMRPTASSYFGQQFGCCCLPLANCCTCFVCQRPPACRHSRSPSQSKRRERSSERGGRDRTRSRTRSRSARPPPQRESSGRRSRSRSQPREPSRGRGAPGAARDRSREGRPREGSRQRSRSPAERHRSRSLRRSRSPAGRRRPRSRSPPRRAPLPPPPRDRCVRLPGAPPSFASVTLRMSQPWQLCLAGHSPAHPPVLHCCPLPCSRGGYLDRRPGYDRRPDYGRRDRWASPGVCMGCSSWRWGKGGAPSPALRGVQAPAADPRLPRATGSMACATVARTTVERAGTTVDGRAAAAAAAAAAGAAIRANARGAASGGSRRSSSGRR